MAFLIGLFVVVLCQIIGGLLAWGAVKGFQRYNKQILFIEIFLMLMIVIELMREGISVSALSMIGLIAGLGVMVVINRFVPHEHDHRMTGFGKFIIIAMLLHEIPEGLAFGSSYAVSPELGIVTAFLIALHNIPEGGIVALPFFLKNNVKKAFSALFATQLAFILGGILSYAVLIQLNPMVRTMFMTFAAGAMLFVIIEEMFMMKR